MGHMGKRRKRKTSGGIPRRLPSGQIHYEHETVAEIRETATQARIRIFGLSEADALSPEASTLIGRMTLAGELFDYQWRAANQYRQIVHDWRISIGAKGIQSGSDLNRTHGFDGADGTEPGYVEWCKNAEDKVNATWRAVKEEMRSTGDVLLQSALDTAAINECYPYRETMGALRVVLNALARHYGIPLELTNKERARLRAAA